MDAEKIRRIHCERIARESSGRHTEDAHDGPHEFAATTTTGSGRTKRRAEAIDSAGGTVWDFGEDFPSGAAEVTIPNRSTGAWQKLLVGSDSRLPTIHDDAAYAKRGPGKHGDHRPPGGETAGAGTTREQKRSTPLSVLSAVFSSAGGFP